MKYSIVYFLSFLYVYALIWYRDKYNSSGDKLTGYYKHARLVFIFALALGCGTFLCVTMFSPFTDNLLLSMGIGLVSIVFISAIADRIIKIIWKCPYCHKVLPYREKDGQFKNYAICPYCLQNLDDMEKHGL